MNATRKPLERATSDFPDGEGVGEGYSAKMPKKPFRLASPHPRESDIQAQIVDYLRAQQARGKIVWFARCNGGSVRSQYKGRVSFTRFYQLYLHGFAPAHKGMADLHGMLPDGRYFALEVKQSGKEATATEEQGRFLAAVRSGGGIAAVVRGFADAAKALGMQA